MSVEQLRARQRAYAKTAEVKPDTANSEVTHLARQQMIRELGTSNAVGAGNARAPSAQFTAVKNESNPSYIAAATLPWKRDFSTSAPR